MRISVSVGVHPRPCDTQSEKSLNLNRPRKWGKSNSMASRRGSYSWPALAGALWRLLTLWSISFFLSCAPLGASAATMTRATLEPLFPPPLVVGEPSRVLPVWPIFRRLGSGLQHIGHTFETAGPQPA